MDWYSPPDYKDYECTECGADIEKAWCVLVALVTKQV